MKKKTIEEYQKEIDRLRESQNRMAETFVRLRSLMNEGWSEAQGFEVCESCSYFGDLEEFKTDAEGVYLCEECMAELIAEQEANDATD